MPTMTEQEYLRRAQGCVEALRGAAWLLPALETVERAGLSFEPEEMLRAYAAAGALSPCVRRNLARGVRPAAFDDPEQRGSGAMERAPLWALLHPGDAAGAMRCAERDAKLDHAGLAAEAARFLAGAMALAFAQERAADCFAGAAGYLDEEGALARLVQEVCSLCRRQPQQTAARIRWRYGDEERAPKPRLARLMAALLLEQPSDDPLAAAFAALLGKGGEPDGAQDVARRIAQAAADSGMQPNAPEKRAGSRIEVSLMGSPALRPGLARQCMLEIHNGGDAPLEGRLERAVDGCVLAMTAARARVEPGACARVPFTVWMPETVRTVTERNALTVRFAGLERRFGLAGAQGYRVYANFDASAAPECTGEMWEPHFADGNRIALDALCGWAGPAAFVLERVMVTPEGWEGELELRHTCPVSVEVDGELRAEGGGPSAWEARRTRVERLKLSPGEHTLVIRLFRWAPGGWIEVNWMQGENLCAMEAVNPLREKRTT